MKSTEATPEAPFVPSTSATAITLPSRSRMDVYRRKALPGVIILVHGVNSDGEWYEAAEAGLCKGLNARLKREDHHCHIVSHDNGQFHPNVYVSELTDDGFIRDDLNASNFVEPGGYSPVIRFRWGYKAGSEEVASIGRNISLNEADAWGGGPFANGCSALPDVWDRGTVTQLFASMLTVQDLNPGSRLVYTCPTRHYQALAAYRLAKLVAEVRRRHRMRDGYDCPVTVICHSQGTMVGLASAFYGKHMFGGDGVASTYLLANSPCSLLPNLKDSLNQYSVSDPRGRVTQAARNEALKRFFEIVRGTRHRYPSDASVTPYIGNRNPKDGSPPWCAIEDRQKHGTGLSIDGHHGRVFVYSNPHDQVVSVVTIQGIGWLGLNDTQIIQTRAKGVLYQRVWAQASVRGRPFEVGKDYGTGFAYDTWSHTLTAGNGRFWYRPPPLSHYQWSDVWLKSQRNIYEKLGSSVWGGLYDICIWLPSAIINPEKGASMLGVPPTAWRVPLNALPVPQPVVPRSLHLYHPQSGTDDDQQSGTRGRVSGMFNQGPEHERDALNPERMRDANDPYQEAQGIGQGDRTTEARLRYEHHAYVRQTARRNIYDSHGKRKLLAKMSEDDIKQLREGGTIDRKSHFGRFDKDVRVGLINRDVDENATNHSTILTNPEHSERVVAYDVDVGACQLQPKEMDFLRRMADWRWCRGNEKEGEEMGIEWQYYESSRIDQNKLHEIPDYSHAASSAAGQSILDRLQIPHERELDTRDVYTDFGSEYLGLHPDQFGKR